jgi:hypothetical protein
VIGTKEGGGRRGNPLGSNDLAKYQIAVRRGAGRTGPGGMGGPGYVPDTFPFSRNWS